MLINAATNMVVVNESAPDITAMQHRPNPHAMPRACHAAQAGRGRAHHSFRGHLVDCVSCLKRRRRTVQANQVVDRRRSNAGMASAYMLPAQRPRSAGSGAHQRRLERRMRSVFGPQTQTPRTRRYVARDHAHVSSARVRDGRCALSPSRSPSIRHLLTGAKLPWTHTCHTCHMCGLLRAPLFVFRSVADGSGRPIMDWRCHTPPRS